MPQRRLSRQAAVAFQQRHRRRGGVTLLQPLSTWLVVWFITASAALVITFLSLGQYARKETATGCLTPPSATAKISAPRQGVIGEVRVGQGGEHAGAADRSRGDLHLPS